MDPEDAFIGIAGDDLKSAFRTLGVHRDLESVRKASFDDIAWHERLLEVGRRHLRSGPWLEHREASLFWRRGLPILSDEALRHGFRRCLRA